MRLALLLLASTAALGGAAAPALAATVAPQYLRSHPGVPGNKYFGPTPPIDVFVEHVVDTDGAANRIEVDEQARVRDTAVPLTVTEGCSRDADGWVTCAPAVPAGHVARMLLAIDAGAGDDAVRLAGGRGDLSDVPTLDLGPGDDRLDAALTSWAVAGGPGADTVAQPGAAYVYRSDGAPDGPASWPGVTWDGGPGPDTAGGSGVLVSYADRAGAVRVTPDGVADDGEPGEGDDVAPGVGAVVGGHGPDVLFAPAGGVVAGGAGDDVVQGRDGTAIREVLDGGLGDDTVLGAAGDDALDGGIGNDTLDGGAGNDDLADGPGADHVSGGAGDDQVVQYASDGAPDVWSGGTGTDRFTDGSLPNGPELDISLNGRADDGRPGEGDDVEPDWESVEIARGRLSGSDGPDTLTLKGTGTVDGRGGDDRLTGGERMIGGPGRDVIAIGKGSGRLLDPRLDARDGERDRVECADRQVTRLLRDPVDQVLGCDRPTLKLALRAGARLALHNGGLLPLTLSCFGTADCRGRLRLSTGGHRRLPSGGQTFGASQGSPVSVRVRRSRGSTAPCGHARVTVRIGRRHAPEALRTFDLGRCTWR